MKKIAIGFLALMSLVMITGCKNGDGDKDKSSLDNEQLPTEEQQITIFDNVIGGECINEQGSLFDFSDVVKKEGYKVISVKAWDNNSIVVLYCGEKDYVVSLYNISEAEESKTLTLDCLSPEAFIGNTDNCLYVCDVQNKTVIFLNFDKKQAQKHELKDVPESMLVTQSGDSVFYTVKDDCHIYQYITESENTMAVYDAEDYAYKIVLKYIKNDDNTIIARVTSDDFIGYADISLEMQELHEIEGIKGDLFCAETEYVYTDEDDDAVLVIYDSRFPRLTKQFELDTEEETHNMSIFGNAPYILSYTLDNDTRKIRFYDISAGIMKNELEVSTDYDILDASFLEEKNIMVFEIGEEDESKGILIWNLESVSEIIH